tara:strand:- start:939 stop:2177 length:1239 start_codon:yes stop_codon:yes gene_type:complete
MNFEEFKTIFENEFQIIKMADIARELDVTPQVVYSWKNRNQVPYVYVKRLKEKIGLQNHEINEKILINSSFFETTIKTLNKHSNLISHMILRFKYSVFLSLILCVAMYLLGTHVFEHKYTAQLKYVPSSNENNGGSSLFSIAQKLGLQNQNNNIDPSYDLLSWAMIPVYLKSKMISEKIIEKEFGSNRYKKKLRLLNILLSMPDTSTQFTESERRFGMKKLQNSLVHTSERNGVIKTIEVSSSEPKLSVDILNQYIVELRNTYTEIFREKNADKKNFLNGRLIDTQKELTNAENVLKVFKEKNRDIFKSPELLTQQNRLLRNVTVLTEVYIQLRSEFEMLLVNEKANMNVFKIIDSADIPLNRVSPNNKKNVLITFIFSMLLINFLFLLGYYVNMHKEEVGKMISFVKGSIV